MNIEDLELILHPMVEEEKEAVGSMGDDTPVAVLSGKYRPLSHFFRQNFSQVTNPPIDSLRENEVMSLKTRFGNLGNILDFENLTKDNIHVLESPILSNSQFEKFKTFFKSSLKVSEHKRNFFLKISKLTLQYYSTRICLSIILTKFGGLKNRKDCNTAIICPTGRTVCA